MVDAILFADDVGFDVVIVGVAAAAATTVDVGDLEEPILDNEDFVVELFHAE